MRMNKRGQAALEFLATYGWAFIVILIVIGALAYFGVTSPAKLLPDRCNFGAEFSCLNHLIDGETGAAAEGDLTVRLRNNLGGSVTVVLGTSGISDDQGIIDDGTGGTCASITSNPGAVNIITTDATVNSGEFVDLTWNNCAFAGRGIVSGEKAKIFIEFDYYETKTGASFTRTLEGEVFSAVQ